MIVGLGIDIVELDRISLAYTRHGEKFCSRILTQVEHQLLPANPIPFLAARFAAKEAAVKALGTGFSQGVTFHDLEVRNDASGKPCITFFKEALRRCQNLQISQALLSISHGRDSAVAVVVLEK